MRTSAGIRACCVSVLPCTGPLPAWNPECRAVQRPGRLWPLLLCFVMIGAVILSAPAAGAFTNSDCSCQLAGLSVRSQSGNGDELQCIWTKQKPGSYDTLQLIASVKKLPDKATVLQGMQQTNAFNRQSISDQKKRQGFSCIEEYYGDTRSSNVCGDSTGFMGGRSIIYRDVYAIGMGGGGFGGQELKGYFDQLEPCMKAAADAHAARQSGFSPPMRTATTKQPPGTLGPGTTPRPGSSAGTGPEAAMEELTQAISQYLQGIGGGINGVLPYPVDWAAVPEAASESVTPATLGALGALVGGTLGALTLFPGGFSWPGSGEGGEGGEYGGEGSGYPETAPEEYAGPEMTDEQRAAEELLYQQQLERERLQAEAEALAARQQQARDRMLDYLRNLQDHMVEGPFANRFSGDEYNRISDQIDKLRGQLRGGKPVDPGLFDNVRQVYEGRVTGRTLPPGQIPSDYDILAETVAGGLENMSREIFTGRDTEGNFSYNSLALRTLLGAASGGTSELAYTPVSSLYTMDDYVRKGGDSEAGAFWAAVPEVVYGEIMGAGIGAGLKHGGRLLADLVDSLPPSVSGPLRANIEKTKNFLNTEIKNPFADVPETPSGIAGFRSPPKADADLVDDILAARRRGEQAPGIQNFELEPAGKPPDLRGMPARDQKAIRMIADKYGVQAHQRPTSKYAAELLESGRANPKPAPLKTKSINDDDILLGFQNDQKGYVACKEPRLPQRPADMPDGAWKRLNRRYAERMQEFADEAAHLREMEAHGKLKWDKKTGLITDGGNGKPFAGDNDMFAYTDPNGKPVSPFTARQINQELQALNATQHNEHLGWDFRKLPDTPGAGGAQSEFGKAAKVDTKILGGHAPGGEPLNTYDPLKGEWGTSYYKGPGQRSFVGSETIGERTNYFRLGEGG